MRVSTPESGGRGHIVAIAGPSSVGKSTLIRRLLGGDLPRLAEALGVGGDSTYRVVHAREWRSLESSPSAAVLLHYELTRTAFRTCGEEGDRALAVLGRARSLTFLTLWERPQEIERRFRLRFQRMLVGDLRALRVRQAAKTVRWFRSRRPFLTQPDEMWRLYCKWFDFSARFDPSPHWVLRPAAVDEDPGSSPVSSDCPFWEGAGAEFAPALRRLARVIQRTDEVPDSR